MAKVIRKASLDKISELLDDLELLAASANFRICINNMLHTIYKLDDDARPVDVDLKFSKRKVAGSIIDAIRKLLKLDYK